MPDGSKPETPEKLSMTRAKAKLSAVAGKVARTRAPVVLTQRGKPVARLIAEPAPKSAASPYGGLRGTVLFCADLTQPTAGEWKTLKRGR